jgi:hypothetical protein
MARPHDPIASRRRRWRYAAAAAGMVGLLVVVALWWQRERVGPASGAGADTVELCGYGPIAPVRSIDDYPADVVKAAEQAFTAIGAELRAQNSPRAQALGLYLQIVQSVRQAGQDFERREEKCDDAGCIQRQIRAAAQAAAPAAQSLARLAASAQDPTVYALAVYGCRLNQDDACAQLSKSRWAQLAPDNAVPWLWLASEAHASKDEAALINALQRAARAKTSEHEWSAILRTAEHAQALELAPAARAVLLGRLIGIYSAFPAPAYLELTEECAKDQLAAPARRQLCDELATMLTERSASMLELWVGTKIGEQVGWPPDRLQRLRDEKDAIQRLSAGDWQPEDLYSCRFVEFAEERVRELATLGELRAGRQRIAASGRPASELAREWRQLQQQREAALRNDAAAR